MPDPILPANPTQFLLQKLGLQLPSNTMPVSPNVQNTNAIAQQAQLPLWKQYAIQGVKGAGDILSGAASGLVGGNFAPGAPSLQDKANMAAQLMSSGVDLGGAVSALKGGEQLVEHAPNIIRDAYSTGRNILDYIDLEHLPFTAYKAMSNLPTAPLAADATVSKLVDAASPLTSMASTVAKNKQGNNNASQ